MTSYSQITNTELEREQQHVDRAYARLDVLRERARERAAGMWTQGRGGTPQARHDRDAFVRSSLYRLEQLDSAEYGLVFGRLDETDGDTWHIGRLGVNDDRYEPLVVDWRAPVAAPFYRATPLEPLGLRRRRHLHMRGRRVVRLDDELLDAAATGTDDFVLVGEGALLAAVARPRSDRMGDIVATIQREQDEVIRAPLEGITIVQGGPGTGKTAVALHRVAYLLYANRDRIEHTGVLVIGPSARFLRYIGDVIPGLGEQAVRLARIGDLLGEDIATVQESPEVRRVKGDVRMATVLARQVRRWPWASIREEDWDALPEAMLAQLLTDPTALEAAARDVLPARDLELLSAAAADGWTEADVALLDELTALVARRRPRRRQRSSDTARIEDTLDVLELDARMRSAARERMQRQADGGREDGEKVYGHVVVDEAQELSAMQWRMLVRRCPSGSMTVVGDLDQSMRPEPLADWEQLAADLPGRVRVYELTVNYRTPAEIMSYVEQQAAITGIRRHPPRSVRSSGRPPQVRAIAPTDVASAVREAVTAMSETSGTSAVIAPASWAPQLCQDLEGSNVVCLTARAAKGLEFDAVVLVAPDVIAREQGGAALYVALTRATRDLVVLTPQSAS